MLRRKEKNPEQRQIDNVDQSLANLKMIVSNQEAQLLESTHNLDAAAEEAYKRGDEKAAMEYFVKMEVEQSYLTSIRSTVEYAESAVKKANLDAVNVEAAKVLQAVAISQEKMANKVDPNMIDAISTSLSNSAAKIQHTSSIINEAMRGITDREHDEAERKTIEKSVEGGGEVHARFDKWMSEKQAKRESQKDTDQGKASKKEEEKQEETPSYVRFLNEMKRKEREEQKRMKQKQSQQ